MTLSLRKGIILFSFPSSPNFPYRRGFFVALQSRDYRLSVRFEKVMQRDGDVQGFQIVHDHSPRSKIHTCIVRHTRVRPKIHSFSYSYLWVSVPVRWQGQRLETTRFTFVTSILGFFDSRDYLNRGDSRGLDGKLTEYLQAQVASITRLISSSQSYS